MNLKDLKKEIPFKWRVQSFSKNSAKAQCVAYIDARDVMNLLDEVCGADNWQSDFKDIGGQTFAGIGIKVPSEHKKIVTNQEFKAGYKPDIDAVKTELEYSEWVWKWDTGSESNIEKEKGQASDSLKRAGVQWGIGRFLYDMDIKWVDANEAKTQSNYPYVVDKNGKRVYDLTDYINNYVEKQTTTTTPKKTTQKVGLRDEDDALAPLPKEFKL